MNLSIHIRLYAVLAYTLIFFVNTYFLQAQHELTFTKNANRNNLLLITGILVAKSIHIEIETEKKIDADAKTEFSKLFKGKFELEHSSEKKLVMSTNDIGSFPIAVKVQRIDFDGGQFVNTTLLSDRRNLL